MSSLGNVKPSQIPSGGSVGSDLYNIEQAIDKTFQDESSVLSKSSNALRILGSMAGVSALMLFNGVDDIRQLGYSAGLMGLSSVAGLQIANVLSYKGYVNSNQEEHVVLPASMALYYVLANRSLNLSNINNMVALQAVAGGASSFAVESYFNTGKPKAKN